MGELRPDISLIAVDPWVEAPGPGWVGAKESIFADVIAAHGSLFLAFVDQMRTHAPDVLRRTRVIQSRAEFVRLYEHVDMLFVDGAHDYMNVRLDLEAFAPLVRKGGIISGHDYSPDFPGVVRAVDEYLGEKPRIGIDGEGVCWWVA